MKQEIKGITFNRIKDILSISGTSAIVILLKKDIPAMGYSNKKLIKLIKKDIKKHKA